MTGKPNSVSSRLEHNIGMSSIGLSVAQLLSHDSASVQEIIHFQSKNAIFVLEMCIILWVPQLISPIRSKGNHSLVKIHSHCFHMLICLYPFVLFLILFVLKRRIGETRHTIGCLWLLRFSEEIQGWNCLLMP